MRRLAHDGSIILFKEFIKMQVILILVEAHITHLQVLTIVNFARHELVSFTGTNEHLIDAFHQ